MSLIVSITHREGIIMASDTRIVTLVTCQSIRGKPVETGQVSVEPSEQSKTFEIPDVGWIFT